MPPVGQIAPDLAGSGSQFGMEALVACNKIRVCKIFLLKNIFSILIVELKLQATHKVPALQYKFVLNF